MNFFKTTSRLFIISLISVMMAMNFSSCDKIEEVIPTIDGAVSFLNSEIELIKQKLPEPKGNENNQPVISNVTGNGSIIAGGTNFFSVNFEDPNGDVEHLLVALEGEEGYYRANLAENSTDFDLTMLLDQEVIDNSLGIIFHIVDDRGNVSEPYKVVLNRVNAGQGSLQVSLAWDLENDLDLHLIKPDGEEIYYGNEVSSTGGVLDLDSNPACDIDGVNNENITFSDSAAVVPAGEYIVRVDYYEECEAGGKTTNYAVAVHVQGELIATSNGNPVEGSFETGTADMGSAGSGVEVMRFNVAEQIGKKDIIVIDYGFTARQREMRTNPKLN
jgi:uncharacterized protein YfaP (DUF2135 family)